MVGRKLPPFASVRAFEAAARHLSVKDAAEELCVTSSAVSHQIKTLEEFLATGLFNRDGNKLTLTRTGGIYLGRLSGLLDGLDASTREVRAQTRDFRVLATPGFAARWLVPRLDRLSFGRNIRLRVSQGAPDTDFACNDADVVIHWADAPVPSLVVEPFMRSGRYPVISPALRDSARIKTPADLLRVTLMYDEVMDGWADWFRAAGLGSTELPPGPRFPHCELSTTAAERGQGVALAYDAIVRSTVRDGGLVRLFDSVTMPVTIYSLAYPEARADDPMIRAFRDWIFSEATADQVRPPQSQDAAE